MNGKIMRIARQIEEVGGRMFIVGGAVRDKIRGVKPKDFDFCITGITEQTAKEIVSDFGHIKDADIISNAPVFMARIDDEDFEFAMARKEVSVTPGKMGFEFFSDPSITIFDDLIRRDFTIGAIAQDVISGEIIDPHNGIQDIKDGIIRCVDPETFVQSPERAFRAFSQAARFGFEVEFNTVVAIRKMRKDFDSIPREQIWRHFEKFANDSVAPNNFIFEMKVARWTEFFPEINFVDAWNALFDLRGTRFGVCDVVASILTGMSWEEEIAFSERICIPKAVFRKAVEIKHFGSEGKPEPWVKGGEIIQRFGIKPGPEVSFWTNWAFIGQINDIFADKDEAIKWIEESI